MARIEVETERGPIWFWGEDRGLPVVLVVTGFRASADTWEPRTFQPVGFDFLRTHLPGNHCPPLDEISVEAYADALEAALASRFPGRPLLVVGQSAGALVALALRSPEIRRLVLLEPPLRSDDLWPLNEALDPAQGLSDYELSQLSALFGVGAACVVGMDYRPLLDGLTVPTRVLLGDAPLLPRRPLPRWPSLVDDDSRAALKANPLVRRTVVAGAGHGVQMEALQACVEVVVEEARQAFSDPSIAFS
jgi:pimeloyl-ACP methyl ester carboxylesterase